MLEADGQTFTADAVVLANGWEARELAEPLGITLPVEPARGQIIISEPIAPFSRPAIHSTHHIYMRQTVSGTCQIGSHTEYVGPNKDVTLDKLSTYATDISKIIPHSHIPSAKPDVIIFPRIISDNTSEIKPLGYLEVYKRLLGQIILAIDNDIAKKQLHVLELLVKQTKGFELLSGRDLYENPCSIINIMDKLNDVNESC